MDYNESENGLENKKMRRSGEGEYDVRCII